MLTRDSILARKADLPRELVDVPEWGDSVYVSVMTGAERDRFEIRLNETRRANFRASLVAFTACDEAGKRLFAEADIEALGQVPAPGLNRLTEVALRLNKFTDDDVKELEKNSGTSPSDASASGSPPTSG